MANLMYMLVSYCTLLSFDKLASLGVKRISMGNALHKALDNKMEHMLDDILSAKSFDSLF